MKESIATGDQNMSSEKVTVDIVAEEFRKFYGQNLPPEFNVQVRFGNYFAELGWDESILIPTMKKKTKIPTKRRQDECLEKSIKFHTLKHSYMANFVAKLMANKQEEEVSGSDGDDPSRSPTPSVTYPKNKQPRVYSSSSKKGKSRV